MNSVELIVTIVGIVAIVGELWYFRTPRRAASGGPPPEAPQEVRVTVKDGYAPETVVVRAGAPVRLQFFRDETAACSERVIFEAFGIDRALPAFETTTIELPATEPGAYPFRCADDVLHGTLVVQPADAAPARVTPPHEHHG